MGTYKLLLDDHIGYDFSLIAIHASVEAYFIAFLINKHLNLNLVRKREDLIIKENTEENSFSIFEYINPQDQLKYHLFSNRTMKSISQNLEGLFDNQLLIETRANSYFLKELNKVDYLIKIYDDGTAIAKAKIIKKLNAISQIVTAYSLDLNQLKTKENLIFE